MAIKSFNDFNAVLQRNPNNATFFSYRGHAHIEGACRYLVKDRMELTGARWRLAGAETVLRLAALQASGDFEDYWQFHLQQEWYRNHRSVYQDGVPLMKGLVNLSCPLSDHLSHIA